MCLPLALLPFLLLCPPLYTSVSPSVYLYLSSPSSSLPSILSLFLLSFPFLSFFSLPDLQSPCPFPSSPVSLPPLLSLSPSYSPFFSSYSLPSFLPLLSFSSSSPSYLFLLPLLAPVSSPTPHFSPPHSRSPDPFPSLPCLSLSPLPLFLFYSSCLSLPLFSSIHPVSYTHL